jgi:hypothetical protein
MHLVIKKRPSFLLSLHYYAFYAVDFVVGSSSFGDTAKREELASEMEKLLGLGSIKDPIPSNPSCLAENQPVCLSLTHPDSSCRCAPRPDEYETRWAYLWGSGVMTITTSGKRTEAVENKITGSNWQATCSNTTTTSRGGLWLSFR